MHAHMHMSILGERGVTRTPCAHTLHRHATPPCYAHTCLLPPSTMPPQCVHVLRRLARGGCTAGVQRQGCQRGGGAHVPTSPPPTSHARRHAATPCPPASPHTAHRHQCLLPTLLHTQPTRARSTGDARGVRAASTCPPPPPPHTTSLRRCQHTHGTLPAHCTHAHAHAHVLTTQCARWRRAASAWVRRQAGACGGGGWGGVRG